MSMLTGVAGFLVILPLLVRRPLRFRPRPGHERARARVAAGRLLPARTPTARCSPSTARATPSGLILALGGGLLADVIGWRETFIVLAIPTFVVIAFIAKLCRTRSAVGRSTWTSRSAADGQERQDPHRRGLAAPQGHPHAAAHLGRRASSSGPPWCPITSFISFFYENVYTDRHQLRPARPC